MASAGSSPPFATPPDPGEARTLDELTARLRLLKSWAGGPSYVTITRQVNAAWRAAGRPEREWTTSKNTVADCFVVGRRRRPTEDLLLGIVEALHPDPAYLSRWRQALRIVRGEAEAATFVQTQLALPDDLAVFTGREVELCRLAEITPAGDESTVVISVIEGMAGVGKTQLAVHAGHRLLGQGSFDTVLFANLRGFHPDPGQPPADPAAVLASFLRLVGVPSEAIPHDLDARAALYRARLHGIRALVVLDNAADPSQVRPLLPAGSTCRTLITSRRALAGLPGAHHLSLDVFTPGEALDYLRRTVGADRIDTDQDNATGICRAVGHLPLALGLTAARINAHPDWTLADHLHRLRARRDTQRLDEEVEASIGLSYDDLTLRNRHLLRMLSLHPGDDIEANAAAALAGTDQATTRTGLDHLLANHLIQQRIPGRYELHDLVRRFATTRVHDEDPATDQLAALARLFDHYRYVAAVAVDRLDPADKPNRPTIAPPSGSTVDRFTTDERAATWLETEHANLMAVTSRAAGHWPDKVIDLSMTLSRRLDARGRQRDALTLHRFALSAARATDNRAAQCHVLRAIGQAHFRLAQHVDALFHHQQAVTIAREIGDHVSEGRGLNNIGITYAQLSRFEDAITHLDKARIIARKTGDEIAEGRTLTNLGNCYERSGRLSDALDLHRQGLALARRTGHRLSEGMALVNIGLTYCRLRLYPEALAYLGKSLTLVRATGDRAGEACALENLGVVHRGMKNYPEALDHHEQALALARETGHRVVEGFATLNLGAVHLRLGNLEQAADHHARALAIAREIGERSLEAEALNGAGETARRRGSHDLALSHHRAAMAVAEQVGERVEQARAHAGIGHTHHDLGDIDNARAHWRQALRLYTELGVPDAEELSASLAALDSG